MESTILRGPGEGVVFRFSSLYIPRCPTPYVFPPHPYHFTDDGLAIKRIPDRGPVTIPPAVAVFLIGSAPLGSRLRASSFAEQSLGGSATTVIIIHTN